MILGGLAEVLFSDDSLFLDKSRCLNRRNRFEPCSLCKGSCIAGALEIAAGLPVIDNKKCINCGLCASVCPSEALRLRDYKIFRNFAGSEIIKCMKSGGTYCLRALTPALWAAVVIMKLDIKAVMPCENCELSGKISSNNLDIALKFLDDVNISHSINIIHDPDFQEELSRRDLIALMFAKSKYKGSNILEDIIWHSKNNLFMARKFIHDRLNNTKAQVDSGVFYDLSVSESCNACGICEGMCPSGSWKIIKSESEARAELSFKITECTGCMLCVKKCPEKALSLSEKISLPVSDINIKKSFAMTRCRHCGKYFILDNNNPEHELCSSCSRHK